MQAGPQRVVMQPHPHMQQTPTPQSQVYDPNTLQQAAARPFGFDPATDEVSRNGMVEQRVQYAAMQSQGQPPQPRDAKAAAQRALGVTAMQPQQHQAMINGRPVMLAQNAQGQQFYVNAAGQPVAVNWQGQGQVQQRVPQNGQYTQAQIQQIQNHQAAQQQAQHQYTSSQQVGYQHAYQQYVQQQQHAVHLQQQQLQQQQIQQQRASQTPTARPPQHSGQIVAQSPALLQVPTPIKRSASVAPSRSASPIPPHMRPAPPMGSQPMHTTASNMTTTGHSQPLLPVRASTLPASVSTTSQHPMALAQQIIPEAGPSRLSPIVIKEEYDSVSEAGRHPLVRLHVAPKRRTDRASAIVDAAKRESKSERLKRHIEAAQEQLEVMQKEEEEARKMVEDMMADEKGRPAEDEAKAKFNDLVLEYLTRAGLVDAVDGLKRDIARSGASGRAGAAHDALGDISGIGDESETSAGGATLGDSVSGDVSLEIIQTPNQLDSPAKLKSTDQKGGSIDAGDAEDVEGDVNKEQPAAGEDDGDSIFGSVAGGDEEETGEKKGADNTSPLPTGDKGSPGMKAKMRDKVKPSSPVSASDLGYLFSWWQVFEDTQRLVKANILPRTTRYRHVVPLASEGTAPMTAAQPTSAMAARIAISAPAVAVRATTGDNRLQSAGQSVQPRQGAAHVVIPGVGQPTAVTAQLQAADHMRRAQQAQIDAQNEEYRRRVAAEGQNELNIQSQMLQHQQQQQAQYLQQQQRPPVILTNGTQVHMTPEQVQQHMMAQQQGYDAQLMHPQAHAHHQLQARANGGVFRSDTPNGSLRGYPSGAYSVENGGSPGGETYQLGAKRMAASPIDGTSKKVKTFGKRPTPEEHQRQALEMASRVQRVPGPVGIPQMPNPMGQFQRPPSQSAQPRVLSDAERQYSQTQANYARNQVMNSPAAMMGMSPAQISAASPMNQQSTQSPNVSIVPNGYDVGMNGIPTPASAKTKAKLRSTPSLNLDDRASSDDYEPPASAALSAKKKGGKAKPGPKAGTRGGKAKGGRGRASVGDPESAEIASTPVFASTPSQAEMYAPPGSASGGNAEMVYANQQQAMQQQYQAQAQQSQNRQDQEIPEGFLESLGEFVDQGVEIGVGGGQQLAVPEDGGAQPMSAAYHSINFEIDEDPFGSFDWTGLNYGNQEEGNDWTLGDTTLQDAGS